LSTSKKNCQLEIQQNTFCKCNTLACGTGGAVVANVAMLRGLISSAKQIKTIHPGGEIKYHITPDTTFMFGPARRIE
jgi:diaminopimelate epimerase